MISLFLSMALAATPVTETHWWESHYQDDNTLVLYRNDYEVLGLWHVWDRTWSPVAPEGHYFLPPSGRPPVPTPPEPGPQGPKL